MRYLRIACLVLLMLLSLSPQLVAKEGDDFIGTSAPEWGKLEWMHSQPLKLSDLQGKALLIRWWTDTPHL